MSFGPAWIWYLAPLVAAIVVHQLLRWRSDRANRARLASVRSAGLDEPASLHPLIDPLTCIGCSACVRACPEGDVLGLIGGKAVLIAPAECIGHGACRAACPVDAITLVIGTERRGVELPHVGPDFQTNVPGLFVAGELGGMGLIRNAVEQGRQAIEEIARRNHDLRLAGDLDADVIIVGAGPAGLAASLAARSKGLRFLTLDQEGLGGTVAHYPRRKLVMTEPVDLPGFGRMRFRTIDKDALLAFWTDIAARADLQVKYGAQVEAIERREPGFEVRTTSGSHTAGAVLLAIGRRGSPRRLGVPGESLPKVVYRLIDPAQYAGSNVLVVGGGDGALEAAASLAEETDAAVTLAYRGSAFARARPRNRERVDQAASNGRLTVLMQTDVVSIRPGGVDLSTAGRPTTLTNDAVIVCTGGVLPTELLRASGVEVETHRGRSSDRR